MMTAAATQFVGFSLAIRRARSRHSARTGRGSFLCECYTQGEEDEVVQVAEVRDQVYRAEGVPDHARGEDTRVDRHPRILVR
jgi:hypothetical protein